MECPKCKGTRHYQIDGVWKRCECYDTLEKEKAASTLQTAVPESAAAIGLSKENEKLISAVYERLKQSTFPKVNLLFFVKSPKNLKKTRSYLWESALLGRLKSSMFGLENMLKIFELGDKIIPDGTDVIHVVLPKIPKPSYFTAMEGLSSMCRRNSVYVFYYIGCNEREFSPDVASMFELFLISTGTKKVTLC